MTMGRGKVTVSQARAIIDEETSWKCPDCGTYLSPGEKRRCWSCQTYYDDVVAGHYEEPWDDELNYGR